MSAGGLDLVVRTSKTASGWSPVAATARHNGRYFHIGFPSSSIGPLTMVDESSGDVLRTSVQGSMYVFRRYDAARVFRDGYALFQDGRGSVFVGKLRQEQIQFASELQDTEKVTQGPGGPVELAASAGRHWLLDLLPMSSAQAQAAGGDLIAFTGGEEKNLLTLAAVICAVTCLATANVFCAFAVPAALIGLLLWLLWQALMKDATQQSEQLLNMTKAMFDRANPVVDWTIAAIGSGSCDDSDFNASLSGSAPMRDDGSFEMLIAGRSLLMVVGDTTTYSESFPEDEGTTSQRVRLSLSRDGIISGSGDVNYSSSTNPSCSGTFTVAGTAILFAEVPGGEGYQLT